MVSGPGEEVANSVAALGDLFIEPSVEILLEEVREACAVSRDGVNALRIVQAARGFGFDARGLRASFDDLRGLAAPFIVFWQQNHFLVVEGIGRRKVWLNDPASGRRTVTHEEFAASFSGVALTITPGADFHRDTSPCVRPVEPDGPAAVRRSAVADSGVRV